MSFKNHTRTTVNSRVSDQNGVSPLYIMLEIHHSGRELRVTGIVMRRTDKPDSGPMGHTLWGESKNKKKKKNHSS